MSGHRDPGREKELPLLDPYVAAPLHGALGGAIHGAGPRGPTAPVPQQQAPQGAEQRAPQGAEQRAPQGAEQRAEHRAQRRQRLMLAAAVSSMLVTLGAVGLAGWGVYHWRHLLLAPAASDGAEDDPTTKQTGLPAGSDKEGDGAEEKKTSEAAKAPAVPDDTRVRVRGRIEVVDVGLSASQLESVLRAQSELARAKGQTLVVMTTGRDCMPCQGVDQALDDPRMQKALAGVRLVRVDLKVFKEELAELEMPTNLYPAFFLLGSDMIPRDGIHGGEWDEDVAENIAPVLGAFVRGDYRKRRHDWSPTTSGISL